MKLVKNDFVGKRSCNFLFAFNNRYYGKGLEDGECGIAIENPKTADNSLWKCFVKAVDEDDNEKDFGSILDASDRKHILQLHPLHKVVLVKGSDDVIMCQANLPIRYCWFQRPNGDIIALTEKSKNYAGLSFGIGQCGIKIHSEGDEAGIWKCSVGGTDGATFETQQQIVVEVRTTDPLIVADTETITINRGMSFRIECMTAGMHRNEPIDSCHFVTPLGAGFNLDESVTSQSSLGDYYYNPNRSLKDGYCSLIVKRARREHAGKWKCFAHSNVWDMEGSDKIQVAVLGK